MRLTYLFLITFMLSGASGARAQTVALDNKFQFFNLNTGQHGHFFMAASPRNVGGKLGICGASWTDGTTSRLYSLSPKILNRFHFKLAGKNLRVNTNRFARYKTESDVRQGGARCAVTRQTWQPSMETATFEIGFVDRPIRY